MRIRWGFRARVVSLGYDDGFFDVCCLCFLTEVINE